MASKKISYNDLKKQNDSNQLAQAFSAGKTVVSQNTNNAQLIPCLLLCFLL